MNVYLLVEGKRCERKLYPAWLRVIAPHLKQVRSHAQVDTDSFFLISGEGYPSILNTHLKNAIKDIEDVRRFDFLIVVLDSDEDSVEDRERAVIEAVESASPTLTSAKLQVVVQNRCIETWLLANRRVFVRNPQNLELLKYVRYYNLLLNDPERMGRMDGYNTHAQFHCAYLKAILQERNISYTKTRPGEVATEAYLNELIRRTKDCSNHIESFSRFLRICESLAEQPRIK